MTSKSILYSGKPSGTADTTALLRAVHQLLDQPLVLSDPLALQILEPEVAEHLRSDPYQYNDWFRRALRGHFVIRNRLVEDEVYRGVVSGVLQYVVLGAGLDTFAFRSPLLRRGLRVFEVDHPSTQIWKRRRLELTHIPVPEGVSFVSLDFEEAALAPSLINSGFDGPACFSWLGVTPYLSFDVIMSTLAFVRTLPRGTSIIFDILSKPINPMEQAIHAQAVEMVAALGEPFVSMLDPFDLKEKILAMGFGEVEIWMPADLQQRYLPFRNDALQAVSPLICARV
jgi:methyltransferase (TIGR00027 family)